MTYPGMSFHTAYDVYPPPAWVRRPILPFSGRRSSNGTMTAVRYSCGAAMSERSAGSEPGYKMTVSPLPAHPVKISNRTTPEHDPVKPITTQPPGKKTRTRRTRIQDGKERLTTSGEKMLGRLHIQRWSLWRPPPEPRL